MSVCDCHILVDCFKKKKKEAKHYLGLSVYLSLQSIHKSLRMRGFPKIKNVTERKILKETSIRKNLMRQMMEISRKDCFEESNKHLFGHKINTMKMITVTKWFNFFRSTSYLFCVCFFILKFMLI